MTAKNYIHSFGLGGDVCTLGKDILGGKGFGLHQMSNMDIPVPPGFTITTEACVDYMNGNLISFALFGNVAVQSEALEKKFGYMPLVSVRSGARDSMPGMMDTILNVGLTVNNLDEWKARVGARTALDSFRRLIQMYGSVVGNVNPNHFEAMLEEVRADRNVKIDAELNEEDLAGVVEDFLVYYEASTGNKFPDTYNDQVQGATLAVFNSWNNDRAKAYRKMNNIPDDWGTAVNIQAMVFGNMNDKSGSGVMFTRNPTTGENVVVGEFLPNAQGEDVVAGIRTPMNITEMTDMWPDVTKSLMSMAKDLEILNKDMQDIEFTVQDGELFILQTRNGKRTATAKFKIVMDLWKEKLILKSSVLPSLEAKDFIEARVPKISSGFTGKPAATGLPASMGVASGYPVFNSDDAKNATGPVILVTHETNPNDIEGMDAAVGILTATGGITSHAAVVARAMNKPCVTGCTDLSVSPIGASLSDDVDAYHLDPNVMISIDGATGNVWLEEVPVEGGDDNEYVDAAIKMLFDKKKLIRKTEEVKQFYKHQISTADWLIMGKSYKQGFDELRTLGLGNTVLELSYSNSHKHEEDNVLWDAFGKSNLETMVSEFLKNLDGFIGLTVIVAGSPLTESAKNNLQIAGINLITTPKTVDDLICAKGPVIIDDEFIDTIIGGYPAYGKLCKILKTSGIKVETSKTAMTDMEAVFTFL